MLDNRIIPAEKFDDVTPHDTNDLTPTRGIYVGVSGDLKVDSLDGNAITFVGISAGIIHPISCTRVYSTGTTATNIVAIY
ncbi:MAG TPA: hypothetical protein VFI27_16490 [candidate division Zixibacteria bacterium]|nr:hypothetical protein [candidate division Zixibacteria bacterium]